jgi:hypothetical protein
MKQKAINRMSHMTSAHLYLLFLASTIPPWDNLKFLADRQSSKIMCAFRSGF